MRGGVEQITMLSRSVNPRTLTKHVMEGVKLCLFFFGCLYRQSSIHQKIRIFTVWLNIIGIFSDALTKYIQIYVVAQRNVLPWMNGGYKWPVCKIHLFQLKTTTLAHIINSACVCSALRRMWCRVLIYYCLSFQFFWLCISRCTQFS